MRGALESSLALALLVLFVLMGVPFFAGGVFWALNARPAVQPAVFTPLLVG